MKNEYARLRNESPSLARSWDRFFFAQEVPYGLAMIRIILPLVMMYDVARRWPYARELFSTDGATAPLAQTFGYLNYLPEFSGTIVVALYTALVFSLITMSLGWFTRTSTMIVLVLYPYFCMLDWISSTTKYVVVATHVLLMLCLARPGAIWSVDAWLKGRRERSAWPGEARHKLPTAAVWPQRLIQLLIASTYFAAMITKLHTPAFFSGEQMQYWLMTYIYYDQPLGDYLSQYPLVSIIAAYATLIWEVLFLACVWRGRMRGWMLGIGVLFHLGTVFMLGLVVFPAIMLTIYLSFLNQYDVQRIAATWRRWKRHSPVLARISTRISEWGQGVALPQASTGQRVTSAVTFLIAIGLFSVSGVALEYQLDHYGIRHPEGLYTLERIPEEEVRNMLSNDTSMREQDKFLSFRIGDWIVADHLLNQRDTFHTGELILAQAALNPPHEDLWVEVNLHDSEGKKLSHVGQIVPREDLRVFFNYRLDESFEPGDYELVLKSSGQEISRRKFRLLPSEEGSQLPAPVAN